jgi:asparagine synthase (glutamine-hydrolysing)
MCGIAGLVDRTGALTVDERRRIARTMADVLTHRGPDDHATWCDQRLPVALSHRRLSIIDLSPHGRQPMESESGRWVITFNGEIYNFSELRGDLIRLGHAFRGHSDTEVALAAVEEWGPRAALDRLNGMFALGIVDKRDSGLWLARDRLGEKPLYYGWLGRQFVFASELKALETHPDFTGEIDRTALTAFMRWGYVPGPHSIYAGISKLPPGGLLTLRLQGSKPEQVDSYWSLRDAALAGVASRDERSNSALADTLDELLTDAVRIRLAADVPLGAFLSGGIDSTTVVAIAQRLSTQPVRTFSIGFDEPQYDESQHARQVADHIGTDHTAMTVTGGDALATVDRLPRVWDEPFADPSQIPTLLLSSLTRQHVTVALSGDGGDELFAGYPRYGWTQRMWRGVGWMPAPVRQILSRNLGRPSAAAWGRASRHLSRVAPVAALEDPRFGDRMPKLAALLGNPSALELYRDLQSHWLAPAKTLVLRGSETSPADEWLDSTAASTLDQMLYWDARQYLPDDILVKVDRASMAHSLEVRVPMLDPRVIEFAWTLPDSAKLVDGTGKQVLRSVLDRYVPRALVERPKRGFEVPLPEWLRGPLRGWADELFDEGLVREQGYLDADEVQRRWQEHRSGERNWHYPLWNVAMFHAWFAERYSKGRTNAVAA